jgi:branched-subunit amino acid aminotransferase/4-amino-4-deoxychorismate lyase
VTRGVVCEICKGLKIRVKEKNVRPKDLKRADGVFLSLTSLGIVAARSLDGKSLKQSPLVSEIARVYNGLLAGFGFET